MTEQNMEVLIPSGERVNTKLLKDGLWTAYEAARVMVGPSNRGVEVVNLKMTGKLLRDWLSVGLSQEALDFLKGKITDEGWSLINKPLGIDSSLIEDEDKFCKEFTERMTRVPYYEALYEGAMDELEKMSKLGPVRIWSAGDVRGIANFVEPGEESKKESVNLRGSYEQLKKAARLNLNRLRKSEENRVKDQLFIDENGQKRIVRHFDVSASEDKFAALKGIMDEFKLLGVEKVIVIDDKLTNARKAKQRIYEVDPTIEVIEVWDRESEEFENVDRQKKTAAGLEQESAIVVYSVTDIVANVLPVLAKDEKVGWIVDMDDVILNDSLDGQLQTDAVLSLLRAKGVITAEY